jgi:hypothetical protein
MDDTNRIIDYYIWMKYNWGIENERMMKIMFMDESLSFV